jgi:sec-independent protein translocase protein TatA
VFNLGTSETLILLVLGVLLFGKRLPDVGRSLGRSIVEFKNGLRGVEDQFRDTVTPERPARPAPRPPQRVQPTAPKFEEPTV